LIPIDYEVPFTADLADRDLIARAGGTADLPRLLARGSATT
jgi:hypothetical protein